MLARRQKTQPRATAAPDLSWHESSMRGLSFPSPSSRKRSSDRTRHASTPNPVAPSPAARMMKKLSTTLRRRPSKELTTTAKVERLNTSPGGRAMTFAEGEGGGVPFFEGRVKPDRTQVAVVKGKPPMWEKENYVHANSFSVGDGHVESFNGGEKDEVVSVAPRAGKMGESGGRRWVLPLTEKAEEPRLFTPPAGTMFERITARRDRTEARALVAACSFLEAEMERIREGGEGEFWEESLRRLGGVLGILEERYQSIEQVYVKSHEYAVAMGRFFEVSPQVINKLAAGHRDLAGGEKNKAIR